MSADPKTAAEQLAAVLADFINPPHEAADYTNCSGALADLGDDE